MRSTGASVKTGGEVRRASKASALELLQDVIGGRHLELARRLDIDMLSLAVLDDEGEALAARSHAEARSVQLQSERLGVLAVAVGEHQDLVADVARLAPRVHHENVVDGGAGNGVDAL